MNAHLLSTSIDPAIQQRLMREVSDIGPLAPRNPNCLLHGDFWPGNLLWNNGQLVGIIDWEDAAIGDPLADLAKCRLEFLGAFGQLAVINFTDCYLPKTPAIDPTDVPFWDLCMAMLMQTKLAAWKLEPKAEQAMQLNVHVSIDHALATLTRR